VDVTRGVTSAGALGSGGRGGGSDASSSLADRSRFESKMERGHLQSAMSPRSPRSRNREIRSTLATLVREAEMVCLPFQKNGAGGGDGGGGGGGGGGGRGGGGGGGLYRVVGVQRVERCLL
jgi:hypothetical protein